MIDWLDQIDKSLMLFLNGMHTPIMDEVMAFITNKKTWIPCYGILVIYILYRFRVKGLYLILVIVLTIAVADQVTSTALKPNVGRLRPCHQEGFNDMIHRVGACGGYYGFASGHAANSFALATAVYLLFWRNKRWSWVLFVWAGIVAYSRVYVGVHFPGDIFFGAILGVGIAYLIFRLWNIANRMYKLISTSD